MRQVNQSIAFIHSPCGFFRDQHMFPSGISKSFAYLMQKCPTFFKYTFKYSVDLTCHIRSETLLMLPPTSSVVFLSGWVADSNLNTHSYIAHDFYLFRWHSTRKYFKLTQKAFDIIFIEKLSQHPCSCDNKSDFMFMMQMVIA